MSFDPQAETVPSPFNARLCRSPAPTATKSLLGSGTSHEPSSFHPHVTIDPSAVDPADVEMLQAKAVDGLAYLHTAAADAYAVAAQAGSQSPPQPISDCKEPAIVTEEANTCVRSASMVRMANKRSSSARIRRRRSATMSVAPTTCCRRRARRASPRGSACSIS